MKPNKIKVRLREFVKAKGMSVNQFEKRSGLSHGYLAYNGSSSADKLEQIFRAFPLLNRNWVLTGDGPMEGETRVRVVNPARALAERLEREEAEADTVKLYDIEAAANLQTLMADPTRNIIGKIVIPNSPKCDGALYIRGDSMYPLLKSGDIVAFKMVNPDPREILFGEMYLVSFEIAGDEYLSVKYVKKSEKGDDHVCLVSYNPNHPPKDIPWTAIRAIGLVKLTVRKNTMV